MAEPFYLIAAPFDIWLAPAGTAEPALGSDPTGDWEKLGSNGAYDYSEDGITVTHEQTVEKFRGLRGTGFIKAFRTAETLMLGFTLHDLSLEEYAKALNDATVTVDGDENSIPLHLGPNVAQHALLARGASPYDDDNLEMQYYIPKVFQGANPAPVHKKGTPAGLALSFEALEDLDAATESERFGRLVAQTTGS